MANTKIDFIGKWDTFHNNGERDTKMLLNTRLAKAGSMPAIELYKDAAQEIQRLIKAAADEGEGLRAYGSAWSLSHIAHHPDRMQYNRSMNIKMPILPGNLHADSEYQAENLFFIQCGNIIRQISEYLFEHGKSLKTTGASNGQTIAGAISTGVHGSAFDFGAVPDYVVGLNLIVGPNTDDIVYLERASKPALNDAFATQINARVIRNDDLFNAALVGLGSFGFIHGVVIEVEDRYLLKRYVRKIDKETALKVADTLNFEELAAIFPEEIDGNGQARRPYHYKVFINPYKENDPYVLEVWYKNAYHDNYPDPKVVLKKTLYQDLLTLFIKVIGKSPHIIPSLINLLKEQFLPPLDTIVEAPLKDICWNALHQGPAFACSVGIDQRDSSKATALLIELVNKFPIPGICCLRFVKASTASLGFTKFPVTCAMEMDGVLWKGTDQIISPEKFYWKFIETLKENDIPFTLHWGKNAAWDFPGLAEHMYGADAIRNWKTQRSALLGKAMAKVFSNDFLDTLGLSEYIDNVQPMPA
ncbi:FAD-binding protein [Haliscomenobacter hydrossis]|uniref:FAD linked oxidase domain protein n=1 Tax=Haliscomenobacter hydrossis (strain ATCC 27775 / DSM 1100 / LMG 10767 / O) TaxID=760192 RepID=F4L5C3_HALH1|nr:FAD-binding protein [Haliscomenobacter hydrossis]AEE49803.1 FAD linked oxidase domain protein [Haliscomenobacter hydrossis DSM 1100]